LLFAAASMAQPHAMTDTSGSLQLAPWQVINLFGAPLLALLFARPVVDDIRAWYRSGREPE
jgi:hypothetical protein